MTQEEYELKVYKLLNKLAKHGEYVAKELKKGTLCDKDFYLLLLLAQWKKVIDCYEFPTAPSEYSCIKLSNVESMLDEVEKLTI